jgi:hypothetical protein
MSITYEWHVDNTTREASTGKIVEVLYSVKGTDGVYSASANGSIVLDGEVTIPYSDVTENLCLEWTLDAVTKSVEVKNEDGEQLPFGEARTQVLKSIEERIATAITEQAAPSFATGLPWSNA